MDYYEVRRKLEKKMSSTGSRGEIDLYETTLIAVDTQIGQPAKRNKEGQVVCCNCDTALDYEIKFSPYCKYCGQMLEE